MTPRRAALHALVDTLAEADIERVHHILEIALPSVAGTTKPPDEALIAAEEKRFAQWYEGLPEAERNALDGLAVYGRTFGSDWKSELAVVESAQRANAK